MNEKSITSPSAAQDGETVGKSATSSASLVNETVGERLKLLYPEHYIRIITEMYRVDGSRRTAEVLSKTVADYLGDFRGPVLTSLFLWDRTAEGREFWARLAERER